MNATRLLCALSVLAALAGCAIAPTHPALQSDSMVRLLPVRDFVANVDYRGQYRISPDGRKLAWMAVSGVRESLFVKSLDTGEVTVVPIKGEFLWAQDSPSALLQGPQGRRELPRDGARPGAAGARAARSHTLRAHARLGAVDH